MHPTRNLFAEFKGNNRVFVETGSYRGDGIQLALDAGYEMIVSIDNDPAAIDFCKNRFDLINKPNPNIQLYHGDSAVCLFDVIKAYNYPITFWLDSHWQMLEGTEPGKNPFPLCKELARISHHHRCDHTIIIDDMLIMQPDIVGYSNNEIRSRLLLINPDYELKYFANPVINNILVAHL
jgi:hypothetical protein